ncbi:MAG: glycosyltransferase family 39 protein [Chloroflexota bacterium]
MTRGARGQLLAVTLVLLLAALRIINIDGPALWTDEGFTYYTFRIDLFGALLGDRHPPFYFYTLHGWSALTGDSIFALRYWSFLPSMLTVAVMFQVGRELLVYRDGAARQGLLTLPVLAALMMALADAENYMAQELRMYSWHVLFAAAGTLAYLRYLRRPSRRTGLIWSIISALSLYTHYFGAFVLIVQGLHALIFTRGRLRLGAIAALSLSGLIFLPWLLAVTLRQFADDAVCVNCATSQNLEILLDFREKWFGQQWPLTLGLFVLGFFIVFRLTHGWQVRPGPARLNGLLLGLLLMPVAGTFALGHDEAVLLARRMVQITVPVALLLALGLANLQPIARRLLVAVLVLYGVTTIDWYRIKVPWDTVTGLIAEFAQPGELALMDVGFEESALLYYYDHLLPEGMQISSYPVWSDEPRFDYYERTLPALLDAQSERQEGVVTAWVTFFSPDRGILDRVETAGFVRTLTRTYDHLGSAIDVYRYDRLPGDPLGTFINGMTLEAVEIQPDAGLAGRVDLWWSADQPLEQAYVVSVALIDENGALAAQYDSPPVLGTRPTPTWIPEEVLYDPRTLDPVSGDALPPGRYTVNVRVYALDAAGNIDLIPLENGGDTLTLGVLAR